ncbi:MAG: SagB family peptide dehydrogenase [Promethearchaeota archaeon]
MNKKSLFGLITLGIILFCLIQLDFSCGSSDQFQFRNNLSIAKVSKPTNPYNDFTEITDAIKGNQNKTPVSSYAPRSPKDINLPEPDLEGEFSLWDCYLWQKLATTFQGTEKPSLKDLSQLLWAAQGITHPPFRACPSAGGTYPLELFVLASTSSSLESGVYQYRPKTHTLTKVLDSIEWDILREIVNLADETQFIGNTSTILLITAEYERTTWKYGYRGIRYVHLEVGHVIQNLILQGVARNVIMYPIVRFNSSSVKTLLDTDELEPLVLLPLGRNEKKSIRSTRSPNSDMDGLPPVDMSIEEAILRRQSIRDYDKGKIERWKIDRLLWAALGARDPWRGERTFPSISGLYPLELYLVVGEIEGIDPAVFHYNASIQALEYVTSGDQRSSLSSAALDQAWVANAQIDLVMSIKEQLLEPDFTSLAERVSLFEAGMCGQNIYLVSNVLGLGTVAVGAFHDDIVESIVDMAPEETPVYIYPVGKISITFYWIFPQISRYYALISRYFALSAFIAFGCVVITGFPPFRRRHRGVRLTHHILAFSSALLALTHLLIIHGINEVIVDPFESRGYEVLFRSIFSFHYPSNPYEAGQILARVSIMLSFGLITFFIPWKPLQRQIRPKGRLRKIHATFVVLLFYSISLHALANGTFIDAISDVFLIFIALAPLLYLCARYYVQIRRHQSRKPNSDLPSNKDHIQENEV